MTPQPPDLVRTTLGVIFIGALIIASLWILRPFLASAIWATMIVVATWPEMRWLESRFRARRRASMHSSKRRQAVRTIAICWTCANHPIFFRLPGKRAQDGGVHP